MDTVKILASSQVRLLCSEQAETGDLFTQVRIERQRITLQAPHAALQRDLPRPGDTVFLQSPTPEALYRIRARVIEVRRDDEVTLVVRPNGKAGRIQRRRQFRMQVYVPTKLVIIREGPAEVVRTETLDLSGGGMRIPCQHPVAPGQQLLATLDLGDGEAPIRCHARVARICRGQDGDSQVGLEFLDIKESDEDRLVTYLTQRQRWSIRAVRSIDEA